MMQYLPQGISDEDVDQWCAQGVVVVDGVPGLYRYCEEGRIRVQELHDGDSTYHYIEDVMIHWPMCGSVNTKRGIAVYVCRRQSRQWRRTYSKREVVVTIPDQWEVMKKYGKMKISDDEVADAVFNPAYPTVETAMRKLDRQERHSVALSPHVIVAGTTNKRVFLRKELVAYIDGYRIVPLGDMRKVRRVIKTLGGRYDI